MSLDATSQAAAVGAAVENVQFQSAAQNLPRKILIIGSQDPALPVPSSVFLITSPEDAAAKTGAGYMIHRLAIQTFKASQGIETWYMPLSEGTAPVKSAGNILITTPSTAAGTLHLYIAGDYIPVAVESGDTVDDIRDEIVDAINNDTNLPVTATGTISGQVDITAKTAGDWWGDHITIKFNLKYGQETPAGVSVAIIGMIGGSGTHPDILTAMNTVLGTGDLKNEKHFTEIVHGYVSDLDVVEDLSEYNGIGNGFTGCYSKTVARPFRSYMGDHIGGSIGLSNVLALASLYRETDRTNGVICVPGSPNHPQEIAANAIGILARVNQNRGGETVVNQIMPGIIPGILSDQWTSDYDNRNLAVINGISPTTGLNGVVRMQNALTVYNPVSVPIASNGYRSMISISKIQNILYNIKLNFSQEKWQGIIIVDDVTKVANSIDRQKTRDISAVIDDLIALTNSFRDHAWIFNSEFTIEKLQSGGYVTIRPGGTGFNSILPILLSGEGNIIDTLVQFDAALDVLLAA